VSLGSPNWTGWFFDRCNMTAPDLPQPVQQVEVGIVLRDRGQQSD
jgi:hypothetical protein